MSIFSTFAINASGMTAQQYRMDVISENLANANTTRTEDGTPYVRQVVTFEQKFETDQDSWKKGGGSFSGVLKKAMCLEDTHISHQCYGKQNESDTTDLHGVRVEGVYNDTWTEMNKVYDPSHPDADEDGYVTYPNVNIVTEMTNLIDASRSYEANATAFQASKEIATNALNMM